MIRHLVKMLTITLAVVLVVSSLALAAGPIVGTPIRRLLSRGKISPLHTLLPFSLRYVAWRLAPDLPARVHPCLQRL